MEIFLRDHPKGKLILSDWSQFDSGTHLTGNVLDHDSLSGSFVLTPVSVNKHLRAFEYVYVLGDERARLHLQNADQPPLYVKEKDIAYYSNMIVQDQNWYMKVIRQARDAHRPVSDLIHENAQWMIDNAIPETKKDSTTIQ
jgi:hypothetical protein